MPDKDKDLTEVPDDVADDATDPSADDADADPNVEDSGDDESGGAKPTAKRGRPAKEPPPPKLWRLEGLSPEGVRVTLGRYVTKEEADPDLERLEEDGFYAKLKITKSKE